ncbi:hypothetical protein D3C72_1657100 [compost metagenome]
MKLLTAPLKKPFNDSWAGSWIVAGRVPSGTKVLMSFEEVLNSLIFKSKYAFLASGSPVILPLAAMTVVPMPLISRLGMTRSLIFPDTSLLM